MKIFVGVRFTFPDGVIVEQTYLPGCEGTPEEWVAMHLSWTGVPCKKERFESAIPLKRVTWPDGRVTDHKNAKDWTPLGPEKDTE